MVRFLVALVLSFAATYFVFDRMVDPVVGVGEVLRPIYWVGFISFAALLAFILWLIGSVISLGSCVDQERGMS